MPKNPLYKELLLLSAIIFGCLLYKFVLFAIIGGNAALDINQHDTYYVSQLHSALWIIMPLTCFVVYLFRAIRGRFNNRMVLVVLMVSTLFIIGWLSMSAQSFSPAYYAQEMLKRAATEEAQNTAPVKGLFYGGDVSFAAYYELTILQVILALFTGFIGMRIGMNWKRPVGDKSS